MPVAVDIPDLRVLADQLARSHDGPREAMAKALLKQGRVEHTAVEERLGGRPEVLVVGWIEDERWPRCGIE